MNIARRHPLSDTCAEHWDALDLDCPDCNRAAGAAAFWAALDAAIGRELTMPQRMMIAHILDEPEGLRGTHDVPQPGRGPRINRISTEAIRGLAAVYEAASGTRAEVHIRDAGDPSIVRSEPGFDTVLLTIRTRLDPKGQLMSDRQFLRRARGILGGQRN